MSLAPLENAFGLEKVLMTSMQAVSGAGYPGIPTLDILGNVIPFIGGEEEKVERETRKLLGKFVDGQVKMGEFIVSAHCNRVMVEDGHTETISVSLEDQSHDCRTSMEAWRAYRSLPQERDLPSAPKHPIIVREERDRPAAEIRPERRTRHGHRGGPPARMPGAAIQIRRAQPQYHSRRRRRGAAQCGIDEVGRVPGLGNR